MAPTRLEKWRQPVTFNIVMANQIVNLKHTVAAIGLMVLLAGACFAQSTESEVDLLLDKLRSAPADEAARIDRDIQTAWLRSGSATIDLLIKRGSDALRAGDTKLAIEHFTALTDHAPEFAEGYHLRAQAYFHADLYGPAIDDLESTLTFNPLQYYAIFGLGAILQEFGNLRSAAQLYRRVLEINPHHENAQKALDGLRRDGIGRTV
ncbi:Tetratricopeptide repeat-containing protein [Sulfitobacter marinus]|uniref:Tetratricopeptide repeat-containing protein n=1 Tax=Sulfitobacter marinus TaxID=394264 RepID=A0A1I6RW01_9RHOB|nr:tetratricopeptide repeat protein [Sulfitobacter marinus]SFS68884.1 Tetratricopeptide repeat-containing protein [Sulfitobacter marinus]